MTLSTIQYEQLYRDLEKIQAAIDTRNEKMGIIYNKLLPYWVTDDEVLDLLEDAENAMANIDLDFDWEKWYTTAERKLTVLSGT